MVKYLTSSIFKSSMLLKLTLQLLVLSNISRQGVRLYLHSHADKELTDSLVLCFGLVEADSVKRCHILEMHDSMFCFALTFSAQNLYSERKNSET